MSEDQNISVEREEDDPHAAQNTLSRYAMRIEALAELLDEKGIVSAREIEDSMHRMERSTPSNGAAIVARAWTDPAFKTQLMNDPQSVLDEMEIALEHDPGLTILENTPDLHHVVVCTLCSCYPRRLLGRPPDWYKSLAYRKRVVVEPRNVISEFGYDVPEAVEVRVVDSSADMRYMVLPVRPDGTEDMTREQLAALVTRDSLIGVNIPDSP
jgi:nitrile hydratase subunit alpha